MKSYQATRGRTHRVFPLRIVRQTSVGVLAATLSCAPAIGLADSSSPRLAAYYDLFMAICGNHVYEWKGDNHPKRVSVAGKQVGVGKTTRYLLTDNGALTAWEDDPARAEQIMDEVKSFHAGRSGLFIIRDDDSLWHVNTERLLGFGEGIGGKPVRIASNALTGSVGDSANYYVTRQGALFVKGRAHRGQYGDGKLKSTDAYVRTATEVAKVSSHTGHALILKTNGEVWGTGGNIYGPLSHHGYGDKAISWGMIFDRVTGIATGSSHSVAIRSDGSLWIWGRDEGLDPKKVVAKADAVAAGSTSTIALSEGALWQWDTGGKPKRVLACE